MYVFTFYSPENESVTCDMIKNVIRSIGGKIKSEQNNVIKAQWRSSRWITIMPTLFEFYVGKDMVRAVIPNASPYALTKDASPLIMVDRGCAGFERVWDEFIKGLCNLYPDIDFGLLSGDAKLDAIKIVGDGMEQVFTSTSWSQPSYGGALIGGLLFGHTGAILGGMHSHTTTRGNTTTRFSNKVLATVRYTNGLTFDGEMSKNSSTYNEIIVNMSQWDK